MSSYSQLTVQELYGRREKLPGKQRALIRALVLPGSPNPIQEASGGSLGYSLELGKFK